MAREEVGWLPSQIGSISPFVIAGLVVWGVGESEVGWGLASLAEKERTHGIEASSLIRCYVTPQDHS